VTEVLADRVVSYGIAACALALLIVGYVLVGPRPPRLPLSRRRPAAQRGPSGLSRVAASLTDVIEKVMHRGGNGRASAALLERSGVKRRLQDIVLLVIAGMLAAGAAGLVLAGPLVGLLLALLVPVGARLLLSFKAGRRRKAFADQLDDSLQLIASSLRAGHSLLQALAAVTREAEEPTREEFARILNENRVGRELGVALDETAARMGSADFGWVTEAIAINREVGGNLAEVLDGVGDTIRERNQIRRQVQALSAEGKLSAYVLMALPFGIGGFLSFSNPGYIAKFGQSLMGYGLIAASVVLLVVGALWLRKVVSFKF